MAMVGPSIEEIQVVTSCVAGDRRHRESEI